MASRHPLPYGFAKAHTLLLEDDGSQRVLWAAETTPASAISEVVRLHDITRFEAEAAASLAQAVGTAAQARVQQRATITAQVYAVLTAPQKAQLAALKAQQQARKAQWQQFKAQHPVSSTPSTSP